MYFILMVWFVFIGVKMDFFVSSDYVQKQGGKLLVNQKTYLSIAGAEVAKEGKKLRFYYCMDYVKRWKSVTVEFDDSIDDIAPGFILSSFTTVTLEPISLRCDLFINMVIERRNTLRYLPRMTTLMMTRYETDDDIEKIIVNIDIDNDR